MFIVGRKIGRKYPTSVKQLSKHRSRRGAIHAAERRLRRGEAVDVFDCDPDGLHCTRAPLMR